MCYSITAIIPSIYAVACVLLFSMQQKIKNWIEKTKQKGEKNKNKRDYILRLLYETRERTGKQTSLLYYAVLCGADPIQCCKNSGMIVDVVVMCIQFTMSAHLHVNVRELSSELTMI